MRQGRRIAMIGVLGTAASCCVSVAVYAQSAPTVEPSAVPGDPQLAPIASSADPNATEAPTPRMDRPGQAADRPAVEALPKPWVRGRESRVGMPAASVDLDPAVIGPPPGSPAPKLYREGDFVVDRLGRLRTLPNGATAFVFVDENGVEPGADDAAIEDLATTGPDARAVVLQPCQRLETMLSAAEQEQSRDALFRLTGQVHVYRGVNYLLPTELTGYQVEAKDEPLPDALDVHVYRGVNYLLPTELTGYQVEAKDEPLPDALDAPGAPDALPANDLPDAAADLDAPAPVIVGSAPTVDAEEPDAMLDAMAEQLEALTEEEPSRSGNYGGISAPLDPSRVRTARTTRPGTPNSVGATTAGGSSGGQLVREGEFVLDRAGRMVRSSDRREVLFTFEADGPELAEAPMGILPCRLRMWMEDAVARRGDAAVFLVSGRVTQFRGANYLLPVSVKLRIDTAALGG